ncbi:MAG TPA: hypothetical protein VEU62_04780, partial [Bryobacterales bacterium]|nr:hypothetical protein [Bryobacterales bacterium]
GGPPDLGALAYRPLLGIAPADLRFAVAAGHRDPPPQRIEIQNGGESPLSWSAHASGQSWLRLSATSGATPAALDVSVRVAGLTPGAYTETIQITPSLEGELPALVRVTLAVVPSPPRRR